MIVSLAEVKAYVGEVGTTYDVFLQTQIDIITEAIEGYCGRIFSEDEYIQTFYNRDFSVPQRELKLYHYPVSAIATAVEGSTDIKPSIRLHKPTGILTKPDNYFYATCEETTVIQYTAGYANADIPKPLKQVVFSLAEEAYNKKKAGIAINFGSDVQRVSIPGTISIDFDYTLTNSDRVNAFGTILKSNLNILDPYRSERTISGGDIAYVEEAP